MADYFIRKYFKNDKNIKTFVKKKALKLKQSKIQRLKFLYKNLII